MFYCYHSWLLLIIYFDKSVGVSIPIIVTLSHFGTVSWYRIDVWNMIYDILCLRTVHARNTKDQNLSTGQTIDWFWNHWKRKVPCPVVQDQQSTYVYTLLWSFDLGFPIAKLWFIFSFQITTKSLYVLSDRSPRLSFTIAIRLKYHSIRIVQLL